MKLVLVIAVVLFLVGLLRSRGRRGTPPPGAGRPGAPRGPQPMVACARCGLHLPRSEAVVGAAGLYCGEAHRRAQGDAG